MKVLIWLGIMLPLILSCSLRDQSVIKEPAGAEAGGGKVGYLTVFSASETSADGSYLPHTSYMVLNDNGSFFDQVINTNEEPVKVKLPVGSYIIRANSDMAGWVNVPIVINENIAYSIHIDGSWQMPDQIDELTKYIRLPDGNVIGWYGEPVVESPVTSVDY